jgi:phosphopantothenoylcysteine decarboxylase/phosphopantothenate--cysteine ligase
MDILKDKRIILGVTGGIAAYKTATLASRLTQASALVDVIMTEAAQKFVAPLTFQALTRRPVYTDMFQTPGVSDLQSPISNLQPPTSDFQIGGPAPHVALAKTADLLIVAPATANTLARLALGMADNLLGAVALATAAPLLLAPAMETGMWNHPATQDNLARLRQRGATVVGPGIGYLASGEANVGRMAEPEEILEMAEIVLSRGGVLDGQAVVVSAGGTQEPIDPVRFITNRSSGKMGYALAVEARRRGARVTLIAAPTALPDPLGMEVVHVRTARQMYEAVMGAAPSADALIMAAAVADYRVATPTGQKIKKEAGESLTLRLERNPDILGEVARQRAATGRPHVVVGFAAETEDLLANARAKLEKKGLDLIVANNVSAPDSGFEVDTNRVTLLSADGSVEALPLLSKWEVADRLMDKVAKSLSSQA